MTDPLHIQLTARPTVDDWQPDCVMDGYQQATIHLGHDDEGDIVATFVRRDPSKLPMSARWRRQRFALRGHRLAVMYVHGWNDYFYRRHESEFWESLGIPFYAVDLRKFGRSCGMDRPWIYRGSARLCGGIQRPTRLVVAEQGEQVRILLVATSQGGLSSVLWLNSQRPHHVEAVALDSPWLELQATACSAYCRRPWFRRPAGRRQNGDADARSGVLRPLHRLRDRRRLGLSAPSAGGPAAFLSPRRVDAGDLQCAGRGVARLDIRIPVLVCTSDRTMLQPTWDEAMREADSVLDITAIRQAALNLGDVVTLATIRGGLHDLSLSRRPRGVGIQDRGRLGLLWMAWRRVIPACASAHRVGRSRGGRQPCRWRESRCRPRRKILRSRNGSRPASSREPAQVTPTAAPPARSATSPYAASRCRESF